MSTFNDALRGPGPRWRLVVALLYLASLAGLAYLAWEGSSYYLTPLLERPRHSDYWTLKPGGSRGILYGIAGATLMTVMLLYSLRKRFKPMRRWGALRYWLDLHILCGVLGPLFIVLHSSFKIGGLVALSFWSMVAVAVSGVLGRYLYLQIPRAASGERLSLEEVEAERARLGEELRGRGSVDDATMEQLSVVLTEATTERRSLLSLLIFLPFDRWRLHRRLRAFARQLVASDHAVSRLWLNSAWKKVQLEQKLLMLGRVQSLFHYWHVIHKPFAVIMYLFLIVHIVVATMTGYVSTVGR